MPAPADNENEYLNQRGFKYFWEKIKGKFNNKVDKEVNKGLSTNDYTNEDKAIVEGIEDTYAKKADITKLMHYSGSVANYAALSAITDAKEGDVYNTEDTGMNYVFVVDDAHPDGFWDAYGSTFSISAISNTEIDSIVDDDTATGA